MIISNEALNITLITMDLFHFSISFIFVGDMWFVNYKKWMEIGMICLF